MLKRNRREKKKPGGIALKPSLWARIDRLAEAQDKSRNEVMEEVLSLHVPHVGDFNKSKTDESDREITEEGIF